MKIIFPDYNNCLTNLSNSILKHFGLDINHPTLKEIDELLNNDYENIIILVYDGLGSKIIDEVLDKNSILKMNKIKDITSVFPATTTAATSSILSGLNPVEHGFLGWHMYFKDLDKTVALFKNTEKDTNKAIEDYNVAGEKLKYQSIIEKINKETEYSAYGLFPFGLGSYETREKLYNQIINLTKIKSKKFIYAYVEEPDYSLHEYSIKNEEVKKLITTINAEVESLKDELKNTLLMVTADHGHIESSPIILKEYPDIFNLLERTTSLEPRAVSFKIKQDKQEEFKKLFNKYFSEDFKLYTKEEVKTQKLFGEGKENKYFSDALGDFMAIGIGNKYINYDEYKEDNIVFKSHHAGLTEEEVLVPLITISQKDDPKNGIIREIEVKDYSKLRLLANSFQKIYYKNRKDIFIDVATYTQSEFFELSQKKNDSLCLVYEFDNEILGLIEAKFTNTSGQRFNNYESLLSIERLIVKEEFRRQKIATKLYEELLKYAKKRRVNRIIIKAYNFNDEAIKFLESINMKVLSYDYEIKL